MNLKGLFKTDISCYLDKYNYPQSKSALLKAAKMAIEGISNRKLKGILHRRARIPTNSLIFHEYTPTTNRHHYHLCFYWDGSLFDRSDFGESFNVSELISQH